jgi:hypothetical protein
LVSPKKDTEPMLGPRLHHAAEVVLQVFGLTSSGETRDAPQNIYLYPSAGLLLQRALPCLPSTHAVPLLAAALKHWGPLTAPAADRPGLPSGAALATAAAVAIWGLSLGDATRLLRLINATCDLSHFSTLFGCPAGIQTMTGLFLKGSPGDSDWSTAVCRFIGNVADSLVFLGVDCRPADVGLVRRFFEALGAASPPGERKWLQAELRHAAPPLAIP